MAGNVQDDDLLLVNRSGVDYHARKADVFPATSELEALPVPCEPTWTLRKDITKEYGLVATSAPWQEYYFACDLCLDRDKDILYWMYDGWVFKTTDGDNYTMACKDAPWQTRSGKGENCWVTISCVKSVLYVVNGQECWSSNDEGKSWIAEGVKPGSMSASATYAHGVKGPFTASDGREFLYFLRAHRCIDIKWLATNEWEYHDLYSEKAVGLCWYDNGKTFVCQCGSQYNQTFGTYDPATSSFVDTGQACDPDMFDAEQIHWSPVNNKFYVLTFGDAKPYNEDFTEDAGGKKLDISRHPTFTDWDVDANDLLFGTKKRDYNSTSTPMAGRGNLHNLDGSENKFDMSTGSMVYWKKLKRYVVANDAGIHQSPILEVGSKEFLTVKCSDSDPAQPLVRGDDILLVNRDGFDYRAKRDQVRNLTSLPRLGTSADATVRISDTLLINRSGVDYQTTKAELVPALSNLDELKDPPSWKSINLPLIVEENYREGGLVCYFNNKYFMQVRRGGTQSDGHWLESVDGKDWSEFTPDPLHDGRFLGNKWTAHKGYVFLSVCGCGGRKDPLRTRDFITWEPLNQSGLEYQALNERTFFANDQTIIACNCDNYSVCSTPAYVSQDGGDTWEDIDYPLPNYAGGNPTDPSADWGMFEADMRVAYGNGVWISITRKTDVIAAQQRPPERKIMKSADNGKTWEWLPGLNGHPTEKMQTIAFGRGRFVIIDEHGGIYHSEDGETWVGANTDAITHDYRPLGNFYRGEALYFFEDYGFVSIGNKCYIHSQDGINWASMIVDDRKYGYADVTAGPQGLVMAADLEEGTKDEKRVMVGYLMER